MCCFKSQRTLTTWNGYGKGDIGEGSVGGSTAHGLLAPSPTSTHGSQAFCQRQRHVCEPSNRWRQVFLLLLIANGLCQAQNPTTRCISRSGCRKCIDCSPKDQVKNVWATYAGKVENPIDVKHKLLFMSPGMLLRDVTWRGVVQNLAFHNHLVAFIVDEAHCVKQ